MSTDLTVSTDNRPPRFVYIDRPQRRSGFSLLVVAALAMAAVGGAAAARLFVPTDDHAEPGPVENVHLANLKASGLFGDIVEGRLINEGAGGEFFMWVESKGEPGCARHTYLRGDSEYNFSFLCNRLTWTGGAEFETIVSRDPPDWVRRTATSL